MTVEDRLSPQQVAIFAALRRNLGQWVGMSRLADAVWADDPNGGPLYAAGVLKVQIHHMRRRLSDTPYLIDSKWGLGYRCREKAPL